MTRDDESGSYATSPERRAADPDLFADSLEPPAPHRRRPSLAMMLVGAGLGVAAAAFVGMWFYATAVAPAVTPAVVALTPAAAETVLRSAHLVSGKATYQVTRDFPAGLVFAQSPLPYARVAQGSRVDIKVAVAPKPIVVPDIVGAELSYAQSVLNYSLLTPTMIYAYSKTVRTGDVVEQLPRAGDTAVTGSADVIVVSLGPGVPGATVPKLIGTLLGPARSIATSATLYAQPRSVVATGVPNGTIVDQAPAAGTLVPVGTNVWVSVAGLANP
jgi:eukaryotic-like serine/threonine-protein kinase